VVAWRALTRRAKLSELLLGIEGLALLRGAIAGSDEHAAARVTDIARIVDDASSLSTETTFPERSVEEGYAGWSTTYDRGDNPLIQLEETVLLPLLRAVPPGRALDAACGTGRVSAHLADAGHSVVGVDLTPAMIELARVKVPAAEFVLGRLEALPIDDAAFDLAVCCLALDHCADMGPPIAELARAVRPGGRVILTDIHPSMVQLGGQAAYVSADGVWGFVRAHPHLHSDYLRAFAASGLTVDELLEPPPNRRWFEWQQAAWTHEPEAFVQAFEGIPAAIVWSLVKA
jgi:ubiquinone/menaquinone biosynthesis C-methylase UbiE